MLLYHSQQYKSMTLHSTMSYMHLMAYSSVVARRLQHKEHLLSRLAELGRTRSFRSWGMWRPPFRALQEQTTIFRCCSTPRIACTQYVHVIHGTSFMHVAPILHVYCMQHHAYILHTRSCMCTAWNSILMYCTRHHTCIPHTTRRCKAGVHGFAPCIRELTCVSLKRLTARTLLVSSLALHLSKSASALAMPPIKSQCTAICHLTWPGFCP